MSERRFANFVPREIRGEQLPEAIRFLAKRGDVADTSDILCSSPVFLLSAGWRSGSTLLQRLICSDRSTLMWGEPFGDRLPISRLSASLRGFHSEDGHLKYSIENQQGDLVQEWIANLNPGVEQLRGAHLAFFEKLFAEPAAKKGYSRWGVKWVRLTGYDAWYLKWLYPNSKLIFLVRHPLSAYRSYRGKRWFTLRPDYRVDKLIRFLGHWRYLTNSFLEQHAELDAMIVKYEDIRHDTQFRDSLSNFTNLTIDTSILDNKLGTRSKTQSPIRLHEKICCRWMANRLIQQFALSIA